MMSRILFLIKIFIILQPMGKQPVQGQKKSKDAIAKAATQKKKVATKVNPPSLRNGPRAKSKKKLITLFSSTRPLTIKSSTASPSWAGTFRFPTWSTSTKSWVPSPGPSSGNVSRTALSSQSKNTASRPSSLPWPSLKSPLLPLPMQSKLARRERRNDPVSTFE